MNLMYSQKGASPRVIREIANEARPARFYQEECLHLLLVFYAAVNRVSLQEQIGENKEQDR